jgi:RNA polymerase sigma-70 factor, ECF subfamily
MAPLAEAAFADLYRRHSRALWSYVYRVTGHAADADDIVQEAYLRMLSADLPPLEGDDTKRYLFRIAGNLMTDRWRRSSREQGGLEAAGDRAAPAVTPPDHDVTRTFTELKPRERALLWLAYVEGEDHEGIARALRVARGSVKVLLSRARARLRDRLAARGVVSRT